MRKKQFTRNVGVLLREEAYQELVGITDKREITLSEFIRTLIDEEFSKIGKEGEVNEPEYQSRL
jgi:macrodomain Ter protein organizer (MatP/YcbG family)